MPGPWLVSVPGGVEIEVLAVPRASRSQVVGLHGGRLKVQLAAPPADGAANQALTELLVELCRVKKSAVSLVHGHGHRQKRVRILGIEVASALLALGGPFDE